MEYWELLLRANDHMTIVHCMIKVAPPNHIKHLAVWVLDDCSLMVSFKQHDPEKLFLKQSHINYISWYIYMIYIYICLPISKILLILFSCPIQSMCLCLCACACVCLCVCLHSCASVQVKARGECHESCSTSLHLIPLRQSLSLNMELGCLLSPTLLDSWMCVSPHLAGSWYPNKAT